MSGFDELISQMVGAGFIISLLAGSHGEGHLGFMFLAGAFAALSAMRIVVAFVTSKNRDENKQ